jgi:hypothetical protein
MSIVDGMALLLGPYSNCMYNLKSLWLGFFVKQFTFSSLRRNCFHLLTVFLIGHGEAKSVEFQFSGASDALWALILNCA